MSAPAPQGNQGNQGPPPPMMGDDLRPSLRASIIHVTEGRDYPTETMEIVNRIAWYMEKDKDGKHLEKVLTGLDEVIRKTQAAKKLIIAVSKGARK